MSTPVRLAALRRHVVSWQRYAARFRRADGDQVVEIVRRLSCVQLDSIATVERSHLLVLGSRAGAVAPGEVSGLLAAGRLFEYWAHEACLVPVEDWPLFRQRMRARRRHHWWGPVIDSDRALARRVRDEIRERGPLASRHFEAGGFPPQDNPRGACGGGGMWNLKPAKRMLDALWTAGELVVSGRQGFQRLYDLPERVLPPSVLQAPDLDEAATLRGLASRAVRARGALTDRGVVEHFRLDGGAARIAPHLEALAAEGALRRLEIDDGGPPVWVPADAELRDEAPAGGVLLSPFENLLWDRAFVRRLFGFDHLIEVYKREPDREYGYYVLPLLVGDRLVGRADLKSHRDEGVLRAKAFHLEPGVKRTANLEESWRAAFTRLAKQLGLAPDLG